mmetsp:Transcript_103541/g.203000  ORF Transcript_103541/g.203000 Transcript_103541/m.203000 type:complete len:514 (+) Transcript_103541:23-1564(+)
MYFAQVAVFSILMLAKLVRPFRLLSSSGITFGSSSTLESAVPATTTFIDSINQRNSEQNVTTNNLGKDTNLGVLFLNLGGPETLQDVEGFLYNLFADPDIIRLPPVINILQAPLAYFIAKTRGPKSAKAYESIGGGSPIVKYTREQSRLVEDALRKKGFERTRCYFAMRYWHPFTDEVLNHMKADGIDTVVVVPLYPHFSVSTSGSSLKLLQQMFSKQAKLWGTQSKVVHTVVPSWHRRPGYINTMAKLVLQQLAQYTEAEMKEGLHVLYSAHGVPESYIKNGDPYQKHITECVALISQEVSRRLASDSLRPKNISARTGNKLAGEFAKGLLSKSGETLLSAAQKIFCENITDAASPAASAETCVSDSNARQEVKPVRYHLSFQSRVGPVQWLRPYTDDKIRDLGNIQKVRNLVTVPVSFVSEHIETLEEIDMEYRELAEECGVTQWRRAPALNTDPDFIADLANIVVEAMTAPTISVTEAASKRYQDSLLAQQYTVEGMTMGLPDSAVKGNR